MKYNIALFPRVFKVIGGVIIGLIVLGIAMTKGWFGVSLSLGSLLNAFFNTKDFVMSGFVLGLVFFAFSKDKIEDESTHKNRVEAMFFAFTMTCFYFILSPILDAGLSFESEEKSVNSVVITMLFLFIGMKTLKGLKKE